MRARSTRVWSLRRRLGLDGNPLRRRSDRVQATLLVVLSFLLLAGCVVGVLAGWSSYRAGLAGEQRADDGYTVTAKVVSVTTWDVAVDGDYLPASIRVTWSDPAGLSHTQDLVATGSPGEPIRLWIDAAGRAWLNRHSHGQTIASAAVTGASTFLALGSGLLVGYLGVVLLINRRRYALWEREWLLVEPGWRRQEL